METKYKLYQNPNRDWILFEPSDLTKMQDDLISRKLDNQRFNELFEVVYRSAYICGGVHKDIYEQMISAITTEELFRLLAKNHDLVEKLETYA